MIRVFLFPTALALLTRYGFCYDPLDGFEGKASFEVAPYSPTALNSFYPTHLNIDFCGEHKLEESHIILRNILRFPNGTDNIHEVSVSAACWPGNPGNFTLLEAAISSLDNVEKISWQADRPITAPFLRTLESKDPPPHLHYTPDFQNNQEYWEEVSDFRNKSQKFLEDRISILNSTVLHSLTAVIENGYSTTDDDINLVFLILSTCPNLRELEFTVRHGGSCEPGNAPFAFNFESRPEVKFPPLEVLRLKGYDFNALPNGQSRWGRNDNSKKTNLECWLQAMDWSHIHTLSLGDRAVYALTGLDGNVTKELNHISLLQWGNQFEDLIVHFLLTSTIENSLESIEIQSDANLFSIYPRCFEDIIVRQSNSLRNFTYKGTEKEPVFLSGEDLGKLTTICRELESMDLTLERPGLEEWVRRFLQLGPGKQVDYPPNFNREPPFDDYYGNYPGELDPIINNATMTKLYRKLREGRREVIEGKEEAGVDIESIRVHVGDWDDRHTPTGMLGRERLRVAYYECGIADDGRESCAGKQERMSMYGWR